MILQLDLSMLQEISRWWYIVAGIIFSYLANALLLRWTDYKNWLDKTELSVCLMTSPITFPLILFYLIMSIPCNILMKIAKA